MVRADGVHLHDVVREGHRLVDEQLQEVVRRGLSGEELELLVHRPVPGDDHPGCDLFRELKGTGKADEKCKRVQERREGKMTERGPGLRDDARPSVTSAGSPARGEGWDRRLAKE